MPDQLKVECPHCNGTLKLKDRSADGKKVRCPKCQEIFKVQLPAEDDLEVLDELEDDFGMEDELPAEEPVKKTSSKKSKKKKKSSGAQIPWAIIGIAAAVLLMVGGLVVVVARSSGGVGSNKIDLTYLLPDANSVAYAKVQEFINCPLLAGVINQPVAKQMLDARANDIGFGFREVVSITIGSKVQQPASSISDLMNPMGAMGRMGPKAEDTHTVTVLRTSAPIRVEVMLADKTKLTPQTHNGKTYHKKVGELAAGFGSGGADSFYFPEPTVMVMAMEADMKLVIDQGAAQVRRKEFDIINPNSTLLMAGIRDPGTYGSVPAAAPASQAPPTEVMLAARNLEATNHKTLRTIFAGVKVTDRVDINVVVTCADSAGAAELKTNYDTVVTQMKSQFEKSKPLIALSGMDSMVPVVDKSLASVRVNASGTQVTTAVTIPSDFKSAVESFAQKIAGAAGGGMGMPAAGGAPAFNGPPGTSGGVPAGFDASQIPPGTLPPGTTLPAGIPAGAIPPGSIPPQAVPAGAVPPAGTAAPAAAPPP